LGLLGLRTPGCDPDPVIVRPETDEGSSRSHDRFWDRLILSDPELPEDSWAPQLLGQIIGPRDHMNVHVRMVRMLGELDDVGLPASDRLVKCP
jgi:hypothetical protein